jgi:flagellar biosynthesis protein
MIDQKELIDDQITQEISTKKEKLAVALSYDVAKPEAAPIVTAVGKGHIADEIVKVAEENNVPLYEDASLVQLLNKLELDTEVPPELYVLVAEVLAFVYKLDRMSKKREEVQGQLQKRPSK